MHPPDPTEELKNRIVLLENRRDAELNLLKAQVKQTAESLKPANIIRNAFQHSSNAPGVMDRAIGSALGITTGYLARKIVMGESKNLAKKFTGILIQAMVAALVAKNTESIKAAGRNFVKRNFSKRSDMTIL